MLQTWWVVKGNCLTQIEKNRIQKIQNSCLRLIYGIHKFEPISHKVQEAFWLNMEDYSAVFYHRIIFYKTPDYLRHKIIYHSHIHNINICFRWLITSPLYKTSYFERRFTYSISLPCYLYTLNPSNIHKKVLKTLF